MFTYYDYQEKISDEVCRQLPDKQRIMVVMPTGTGKTVTMRAIVEKLGKKPILFLVHKKELIDQIHRTLRGLGLRIVVEQAERNELTLSRNVDIAIVSIQTALSRPQSLDNVDWAVVFIDETHRALADGYKSILEYVGCFRGVPLIGMTATPFRTDGGDLSEIYNHTISEGEILDFIKRGYLVPIRAKRILYVQDDEVQVDEDNLFPLVVNTFRQKCVKGGQITHPTLIMVNSLEQGQKLSEYLQKHSIRNRMVDYTTPNSIRARAVEDFRKGRLPVLLSYSIFIEGFDAPNARALFWLRNTNSPLVFVQGLGRITRPDLPADVKRSFGSISAEQRRALITKSRKPDALFVDFCNVTSRNLLSLASILGLDPGFDFEEELVHEVVEEIDELQADLPLISTPSLKSVKDIKLIREDVDLWTRIFDESQNDIPENAQLVYTRLRKEIVSFLFDDKKSYALKLKQNDLGQWEGSFEELEVWKKWYWNGSEMTLGIVSKDKVDLSETITMYEQGKRVTKPKYVKVSGSPPILITRSPSLAYAIYELELYVYNNYPDLWPVIHKNAAWRHQEPTPNQLKICKRIRKRGIPLPTRLTRGNVSQLLSLYYGGFLKFDRLKTAGGKKKKSRRAKP